MTGSLSVRGDVMPLVVLLEKLKQQLQSGMKKVIIPESNMDDVLIEERYRDKIEIIPVKNMSDVLENALLGTGKDGLVTKMKKITNIVPKGIIPKPAKPTIH